MAVDHSFRRDPETLACGPRGQEVMTQVEYYTGTGADFPLVPRTRNFCKAAHASQNKNPGIA
jgi:hypothetical protein